MQSTSAKFSLLGARGRRKALLLEVKVPGQIQRGGVNQQREEPTQDTSAKTTDRKKTETAE